MNTRAQEMKTRAQEWSARAYERVRKNSGKNGGVRAKATRDDGKYKTSCMKMPGLIHQSGLLQALVFQVARDDSGEIYVDHLAQTYFGQEGASHRTLIEHAQQQELKPYMALTHDIAEIAQWFRRFAQIELSGVERG